MKNDFSTQFFRKNKSIILKYRSLVSNFCLGFSHSNVTKCIHKLIIIDDLILVFLKSKINEVMTGSMNKLEKLIELNKLEKENRRNRSEDKLLEDEFIRR